MYTLGYLYFLTSFLSWNFENHILLGRTKTDENPNGLRKFFAVMSGQRMQCQFLYMSSCPNCAVNCCYMYLPPSPRWAEFSVSTV